MKRIRALTVDLVKPRVDDRRLLDSLSARYSPKPPERPCNRLDCKTVQRPCPFVGCRYNLFLDVSQDGLAIKFNYPDIEPGDMDPGFSCALDVANRGGLTLEEVGDILNLTRERIRQIEAVALNHLADVSEMVELFYD